MLADFHCLAKPLFEANGKATEECVEAKDFGLLSWLRERGGIGIQRELQALSLVGPVSKDTRSTSWQVSRLY